MCAPKPELGNENNDVAAFLRDAEKRGNAAVSVSERRTHVKNS
jgi:hypothetical protein